MLPVAAVGWLVAVPIGALSLPAARAESLAEPASEVDSMARAAADVPRDRAARSADAGAFLPLTLSPQIGDQKAFAVGLGGYDSARSLSMVSLTGDLKVTDSLAVRVGGTYDNGAVDSRLQPHVGLRWQALHQDRGHLVDGAVGLFYRRERYSYDEGLIQGVVAVGRTVGRWSGFANLAYGQDPEGDDRDGELRLGAMCRITERLQLGVDSRLRIDLWSSDARRAARNESSRDIVAGPVGSFALGTWVLLVQTGLSQIKTADTQSGFVTLGGVGTVF